MATDQRCYRILSSMKLENQVHLIFYLTKFIAADNKSDKWWSVMELGTLTLTLLLGTVLHLWKFSANDQSNYRT